ncbi:MAG: pyrimidine/purine nucleoside phosphorylase [Bacteroidia bacterium]|nr:pyrimidine/purine nucleoside phosphorylase [Bacteroidia bacterium]
MFKTKEYFDGKVKSIAFKTTESPATIGVMAPGAYEFGTSSVEYMTVVSGLMNVLLPGATEWKSFRPFDQFIVPKDSKFKLEIAEETAYLCLYK